MSSRFKGYIWRVLIRDTPDRPWRVYTWRFREDLARAIAAGLEIGKVLPAEQIKVKRERI